MSAPPRRLNPFEGSTNIPEPVWDRGYASKATSPGEGVAGESGRIRNDHVVDWLPFVTCLTCD
ncbi:hypothetical protein Acor_82450 [Acrocarpospora corrugata]|uniref:Uncharacterized protein n=1 Tax=Acrocarpospora corrugata TaxID=35763 RepID=A0A5M3WBI1_9ACTN|nr:hypothetical protein Acor_82450 [Acrocarpospora corrugata]